jgi:hypothetical protein
MKQEEHENISLAMFGEKHQKVHEFLDQFFPKYGIYHRVVLHHRLGITLVVQKFSESARLAAEQHIMDDMGCIPNDFREFDFNLDHANSRLPGKDLMADLRQLYPGWI